jgi:hypothetical protein
MNTFLRNIETEQSANCGLQYHIDQLAEFSESRPKMQMESERH